MSRSSPGACAVALSAIIVFACTVDSEDGATSLGSTTLPGTSVTTTFGTTMMTSTSVSSTTSDGESTESSDPTSDSGPDDDSSGPPAEDTSGSATGPDEQPPNGIYSACEDVTECFGATVCVLVMGTLGYCSDACTIAADCDPSPAGTATPNCLPASVNGVDMQVCALDCGGGKTCPGGMECLPLGASMACV